MQSRRQPDHPTDPNFPPAMHRATAIIASLLPPVAVFVVLTLTIELLVRSDVFWSYLVPAPSSVLAAMFESRWLWEAMGQTGLSAVIGFALSALVGIMAAVLLSSSRLIQQAFYPYAVFFQTVPIIAIAPLLVIWFGYGMNTVIASAFIVSLFPVIAGALSGLRSTDPALVDLFRLYGAGWWKTLWKLRLPAALPSILTGLRIAGGLAVIGAIAGEFVGGSGLGEYIEGIIPLQRADLVFAAVLLAALLGLGLFATIGLISRLALRRWHVSEQ